MAAAELADWNTVSNVYERIRLKGTWWANSKPDAQIANELWHPVHETYYAFRLLQEWPSDWLNNYVQDVLGTLPAKSILLAGTDSGRFLCEMFKPTNTIIITQNALVDRTYIDYIHDVYGANINIPLENSTAIIQNLTNQITTSASKDAKLFTNGKIELMGVQGVMLMNGALAQVIFDTNKDQYSFFIEEAYAFPWMYSHLEPCGPIMKLNKHVVSLTPGQIENDMLFWSQRVHALIADDKLQHFPSVKQTYAQMRCSIGNIYSHHNMLDKAEIAYREALTLHPESPTINLKYINNILILQKRFSEAHKLAENLDKYFSSSDFIVQIKNAIKSAERQSMK